MSYDWQDIGWMTSDGIQSPGHSTFTVTAEALLPAPETRVARMWRRLLRRPAPVIQPPGTQPLTIEWREGDLLTRYYFPAARLEHGKGA